MDVETRRLVEEAVERARHLLETRRTALDQLAARLFEKETVEADEIAGILAETQTAGSNGRQPVAAPAMPAALG